MKLVLQSEEKGYRLEFKGDLGDSCIAVTQDLEKLIDYCINICFKFAIEDIRLKFLQKEGYFE